MGRRRGVTDAQLLHLAKAPDDAVHADVIEDEVRDPQRAATDVAVTDGETLHDVPALTVAAIRHLDGLVLVGEEHDHVAVRSVQRGVVRGDRHLLAEFARDAEVAGAAVAERLDQSGRHVSVPHATVVRAGDSVQLRRAAILVEQHADVLDRARNVQAVVEAIDHQLLGQIAEVTRGSTSTSGQLTEGPVRRLGANT